MSVGLARQNLGDMVDWPGDEDSPGRNYGEGILEEDRFLYFRGEPAESTDHGQASSLESQIQEQARKYNSFHK